MFRVSSRLHAGSHYLSKRALSIGVVGAGQMGCGIAQVAATAKHQVFILDSQKTKTDKALGFINVLLKKDVLKGKLTQAEADQVLERLVPTTDVKDLADCDFVIEAIVESAPIKRELFGSLDKIVKKDAILGTCWLRLI
ncbi:hypothetical protein HDU91_002907 [Kappamyces sp. JEL0680]|nr:hypothetical protein HDU91_002907 [Kappamyces sp. JEL0680]